jgi:hypothetical protein
MYYFQSPQSNILTIDWIVLLFMLNEIQIVLLIIQLCFRKYYVNRGSGRRTRRTRHHRWWYISFSTSRPLNKIEMNEWYNQTRYNICDHWALTHAQLRYPFRRRGRRRPYQLPLRLINHGIYPCDHRSFTINHIYLFFAILIELLIMIICVSVTHETKQDKFSWLIDRQT